MGKKHFPKFICTVELQRLALHNHKSFQKYKYWKEAALGNWVKYCNVWVVAWWKSKDIASVTLSHGSSFYNSVHKAKQGYWVLSLSAALKIYHQLYLSKCISETFCIIWQIQSLLRHVSYSSNGQLLGNRFCSLWGILCMQSLKCTALLNLYAFRENSVKNGRSKCSWCHIQVDL